MPRHARCRRHARPGDRPDLPVPLEKAQGFETGLEGGRSLKQGLGQQHTVFVSAGRRQGFFGRSKLEAKELLYCGKGQRSWLFLRQADTVAVLKPTVKLDNKIVKVQPEQRVARHSVMSLQPANCGSKSQITVSPNCSKFRIHVIT